MSPYKLFSLISPPVQTWFVLQLLSSSSKVPNPFFSTSCHFKLLPLFLSVPFPLLSCFFEISWLLFVKENLFQRSCGPWSSATFCIGQTPSSPSNEFSGKENIILPLNFFSPCFGFFTLQNDTERQLASRAIIWCLCRTNHITSHRYFLFQQFSISNLSAFSCNFKWKTRAKTSTSNPDQEPLLVKEREEGKPSVPTTSRTATLLSASISQRKENSKGGLGLQNVAKHYLYLVMSWRWVTLKKRVKICSNWSLAKVGLSIRHSTSSSKTKADGSKSNYLTPSSQK